MNYYDTDYKFYCNKEKTEGEKQDIDFLARIQKLIADYNKNDNHHFWLELRYAVRRFS